jgi:hypothetical protein
MFFAIGRLPKSTLCALSFVAGTALATPAVAADNHVLTLSAVGDYMTVPHSASLAAGSELTVEYWLLFRNTSGSGRIAKSAPSDGQWGFGPTVGQNASGFVLNGPAVDVFDVNGFTIERERWVHVAATWKQSTGTAKVYIDGQLIRTVVGSTAPMQATTYPVLIGMQPGYANSQLFGSVDNFRIWNVERSAQQIETARFKQITPAETSAYAGLVANYTFENGAADSTGVNNGTLMGGAAITVDNNWLPPAPTNKVLKLSAVGDYMTVAHSASLAASSELTIEYWLNFRNKSSFGRIGKAAPSDGQWGLAPRVGENLSAFDLGGPAVDVNGANGFTLPRNEWVHVAATWKQSTGTSKVYIDGQLVRTVVGSTAPMQATTYPVLVGQQPGFANSQLFGSVDNFRIWTVERTAQQIEATRYVQINSGETSAYPGLVASYTFENGATDATGLNNGVLMGGATTVEDDTYFPAVCIGDIAEDGQVDAIDLAAVISQWGQAPTGVFDADVDNDGIIGPSDLSAVLSNWGPCLP